jgi:hypothetical protein
MQVVTNRPSSSDGGFVVSEHLSRYNKEMAYKDIASAKGGDPFVFSYDYANVADTFTFEEGDWLPSFASANVSVTDAVRPGLDPDSGLSLAGEWMCSVNLSHLIAFTSAHVDYDGTSITMQYTLDGSAWVNLPDNGAINLAGDPDFDLRVQFAGGVSNDPAELRQVVVYVFKDEVLDSLSRLRTMTVSSDPMVEGVLKIDAPITVNAAVVPDNTFVPEDGTVIGSANLSVGTIEMFVKTTSGLPLVSPQAGTYYTNGAAGNPTAGGINHVVYVRTSPANGAFTLAGNQEIAHLAVYPQAMNAAQVQALYNAQVGSVVVRVDDASEIGVTEGDPAADLYAYTWAIVSGGT